MMKDVNWLGEAALSRIDPLVIARAREIKRKAGSEEAEYLLAYARKYMNTLKNCFVENQPEKYIKHWRKRTASQIMADGWEMSCSDVALVFVTLSRAMGILSRVVEAVRADWLRGESIAAKNQIKNHVFAELFVNGEWQPHNPSVSRLYDGNLNWNGNRYVAIGKGLDYSEVYLSEGDSFSSEPRAILTRLEMTRIAQKYKENTSYWSARLNK